MWKTEPYCQVPDNEWRSLGPDKPGTVTSFGGGLSNILNAFLSSSRSMTNPAFLTSWRVAIRQ